MLTIRDAAHSSVPSTTQARASEAPVQRATHQTLQTALPPRANTTKARDVLPTGEPGTNHVVELATRLILLGHLGDANTTKRGVGDALLSKPFVASPAPIKQPPVSAPPAPVPAPTPVVGHPVEPVIDFPAPVQADSLANANSWSNFAKPYGEDMYLKIARVIGGDSSDPWTAQAFAWQQEWSDITFAATKAPLSAGDANIGKTFEQIQAEQTAWESARQQGYDALRAKIDAFFSVLG